MAFPTGWGYYLPITIDHTKIAADLTDWTFVFDQTYAAALTAVNGPLDSTGTNPMNADGSDIRFSTDAAGAAEIAVDVRAAATAPGGAGTLEVAVKIPNVSSTLDTVIYMWFGNSAATLPAANSTYGQYAAYDGNYQQVYSFNGSAPYTDRTAAQATATAAGGTYGTAPGKIGSAFNITAVGTSLTLATPLTGAQQAAGATLELLFNWTSGATGWQNVFAQASAASGLYLNSTGQLIWYNSLGNTNVTPLTAGTWYLMQVTFDATPNLYVYVDNTLDLSEANNPEIDLNELGTDGSTESALGLWDELRISTVQRSPAWLAANYYNVQARSLSTFGVVTVPSAQSVVLGGRARNRGRMRMIMRARHHGPHRG